MPEVPARRDMAFKTGPGDKQTPNLLGRNWATLKERAKTRKAEQQVKEAAEQPQMVGPVMQEVLQNYADLPQYSLVDDPGVQDLQQAWEQAKDAQQDPLHRSAYYQRLAQYFESRGEPLNAQKYADLAAKDMAAAQATAWANAQKLPTGELPPTTHALDRSAGATAGNLATAAGFTLLGTPKSINTVPLPFMTTVNAKLDPLIRGNAAAGYNALTGKTDLLSRARRSILEPFTHAGTNANKFTSAVLNRSTAVGMPAANLIGAGIQAAKHDQDEYEDDVMRRKAALNEMSAWRRALEYTAAGGEAALGTAANVLPGAGKLVSLVANPYDASRTLTAAFTDDNQNPYIQERRQAREQLPQQQAVAQMRQLVEQLHPELPVHQKDILSAQWAGHINEQANTIADQRKMHQARLEAYHQFGGKRPQPQAGADVANVYEPIQAEVMDSVYGKGQWTPDMADTLGKWQHVGLLDQMDEASQRKLFQHIQRPGNKADFLDPYAFNGGEGLRKSTQPAYQHDEQLWAHRNKYFQQDAAGNVVPNREAWDAARTMPQYTPEAVYAQGQQQLAAADQATQQRQQQVAARDAQINQQRQALAARQQQSNDAYAQWRASYDQKQQAFAQNEVQGDAQRTAWAQAHHVDTPTQTTRPATPTSAAVNTDVAAGRIERPTPYGTSASKPVTLAKNMK